MILFTAVGDLFILHRRRCNEQVRNSLPRAFRIGDGRGGDKGAYALGLRGVRGPRAP
jgi:hypothetical protein